MLVPKNQTVTVECRANKGPVEKLRPVLFVPGTLAKWPDGLEVNETLLNIKPGNMFKVKIAVHNGTDHDLRLRNCTTLGFLKAVLSVTPAEVQLAEDAAKVSHEQPEPHAAPRVACFPPAAKQGRFKSSPSG